MAGSVWLLALAQHQLTSRTLVLAGSAGAAYAAFILQVPVLLSLEIVARPFPWPPLVKAVLVGTLAVAASFALGWLLVKRTPSWQDHLRERWFDQPRVAASVSSSRGWLSRCSPHSVNATLRFATRNGAPALRLWLMTDQEGTSRHVRRSTPAL